MYAERDLINWLKDGEGPRLDFKHTINSLPKIARSIGAFANSKGGLIVVGIDDNKDILGVNADSEKYQLERAVKENCKDAVSIVYQVLHFKGATILIAEVEESSRKPIYITDKKGREKLYIRIQDECVIADTVFQTYLEKGSLNNAIIDYRYMDNIRKGALKTFSHHKVLNNHTYAEMKRIDPDDATRRLLNLVLEGLLIKEPDTFNFSLSPAYVK